MHQRDAQRAPGKAEREILARSLGDLKRLLDVAQRGVVGQQHPGRYRETVGVCDDDRHATSGRRCGPWPAPGRRSSRHPARPSAHRAVPRVANAIANGDPKTMFALGGVAVGQVDDGLRPAQQPRPSRRSRTSWRSPRGTARPSTSDRRSTRPAPWFRRPAATPPAPGRASCAPATSPAMPMASDALVPGGRAQLPQLLESRCGDVDMDSEGVAAQQGASGNAHRSAIRIVGGQRVGDLARPLPTDPRRRDVAGGRPRAGAHVPADTRRADRLRPPDVRRSRRRSRRPNPGHAVRWRRRAAGAARRDPT